MLAKPVNPMFNPSHPMAHRCVAFWPLAEDAGNAVDVVQGITLTPQTSAGRTPTWHGPGLNANANQTGLAATAPASVRLAFPFTLALVATRIGAPSTNASLFGASANNTDASPFVSYGLAASNDGTPVFQLNTNNAGTFSSFNTGLSLAGMSTVSPSVLVGVFTAASRVAYVNGVSATQTSTIGSPTYGTTATLGIGFYPAVTRNANLRIHCAGIWSEAWSAERVAQFGADPFAMVRQPSGIADMMNRIAAAGSAAKGLYYRYLLGQQ